MIGDKKKARLERMNETYPVEIPDITLGQAIGVSMLVVGSYFLDKLVTAVDQVETRDI